MDADENLTQTVIGAAYCVANSLGAGFLESIYRRALVLELRHSRVVVEEEVPFPVVYRGEQVGLYKTDLLIEKRLIVELKACDRLAQTHVAQTINYLAVTGLKLGLLLNFGASRVQVKRVARSA